jgi:putative tryptophan/tyrosine transport system substrate-binding protein
MRKQGWVLGENLSGENVFADSHAERLAAMAEDLVRKRVDIIFTEGPAPTLAAARATRTIPIVFFSVPWPVELGLIDSYARPGRNVTGIAASTGVEAHTKRLEFLRQIAPKAKRLSWLWEGPVSFETLRGARFDVAQEHGSALERLGFQTRLHTVRPMGEDLNDVFKDVAAWRAEALAVSGDLFRASKRIADLAMSHRLPGAGWNRDFVDAGGLLSYGVAQSERDRVTSEYVEIVDRIFRGTAPADIPVARPSRYELIINLKAARTLGLTVPQPLLTRADEVIL